MCSVEQYTDIAFGLILREEYSNQFGKAEKILLEFAPDGQLKKLSGDITVDKMSDFWKNALDASDGLFCPECGSQIYSGSKFCMNCGHKPP